MRDNTDIKRINKFILEAGMYVSKPVNVYFNGGATAVMFGVRESTIDVDLKFEPDEIQMYKVIQQLKEKLNMNIELASPDDFIPPLPKWKQRSIFISSNNKLNFYHYDLYSQIISKVQRGWKQDLTDASAFLKIAANTKLLMELFNKIKKDFIRYPAVNVDELEKKLKQFLNESGRKK